MKKILGIALALVMGLSLSAGSIAKERTYKIAYIARAQGDSFAAWLANAIKQEVENYPDLRVDVFDGESRNEVIAAHIENAVTNRYDLILLQPLDSEAQVAPAAAAMDAGVKVVTVNNRINDNNRAPAVDADPVEQAAKNARLAVNQVPKNGNVVVLMGPAGNMHSDQRRVGWQQEFFKKRPDVKILDEQIANWNKDEAMRFMEDWIQTYPKIDAIIAMNDNMAAGALEATKAAKIKNILAYGVDGTVEACLLIQAGEMTSTTLQSAYELADKSIKLCHDILTGKKQHDVVMVDCPLITKDNAKNFLEIHKRAGNLK